MKTSLRAEDLLVEIVERERALGEVEAVGGGKFVGFAEFEFLGQHEGDFGQLDGEGDDIEAEEIREQDEEAISRLKNSLRERLQSQAEEEEAA